MFQPKTPFNKAGTWVGDASELGATWDDWERIAQRNAHAGVVYNNARTREGARGKSERFHCPTCGYDRQISNSDLGEIVLAFDAAGIRVFDISTRG